MEKTPGNYNKLLRQMDAKRVVGVTETETGVYLVMLDEIGMTITEDVTSVISSQYPNGQPIWAPGIVADGAPKSSHHIVYAKDVQELDPIEGLPIKLLHKRGEKAKPPYDRKIEYAWSNTGLVVWK